MVLIGDRSTSMEQDAEHVGFVVLGVLLGILLSVIFSDAGRPRRQAHRQLEDMPRTLDQELEKLLTSKDDHQIWDTKYLRELLVKVKDKCNHGLVMLEAKQGRYKALMDEFERKLNTEKEQVEQRLQMGQQKHIEERLKLEEEVASVMTVWNQIQPTYAANMWNDALNKRLGTQVRGSYMLKFFENNSSRLPKWCNDGDTVKLPICQIKGKYKMELPEYNIMEPYPI